MHILHTVRLPGTVHILQTVLYQRYLTYSPVPYIFDTQSGTEHILHTVRYGTYFTYCQVPYIFDIHSGTVQF